VVIEIQGVIAVAMATIHPDLIEVIGWIIIHNLQLIVYNS
jgi:hypothetical protein